MTAESNDRNLLREFLGGRNSAFEDFYDLHAAPLFQFMLNRLGDEELCAEAMQDFFVQLHRNPKPFLLAGNFSAYFYQSAANFLSRFARSRGRYASALQRAAKAKTESLEGKYRIETGSWEISDSLSRAVAELQPIDREILLLHLHEELSFQEIGRHLSMAASTAHDRYRQALNQLKLKMGNAWRE